MTLAPADIDARYEFRTFGQDFASAAYRMARLSEPVPEDFWERHSQEIYLISETDDRQNIKLRDAVLDIKVLTRTSGVLEQWKPVVKVGFPISSEKLETEVLPHFSHELSQPVGVSLAESEFLDIVRKNPELHIAYVQKERHGYKVNGNICEVASVLVNGARLTTVSVESTDVDAVMKTIADIGLNDFENINYVQAIQRVIGLSERPFAN